MRQTWTFHSAAQLVFGPGAAAELGELAQRMRLSRVLVVTDRSLVGAGLLKPVQEPLTSAGITVEVFDGGEPEPSLDVAEHCITQALAFQPDGILGLGGGSNMDLAKIAAAVLTHGGNPRDYVGDDRLP